MKKSIESIRREIDLMLSLRIKAEKHGQTILAGLHTARMVTLVSRLESLV